MEWEQLRGGMGKWGKPMQHKKNGRGAHNYVAPEDG
jgi:hypothetical protein